MAEMTFPPSEPTNIAAEPPASTGVRSHGPGSFLFNMNISSKLNLSFGLLVALTLALVLFGFIAVQAATERLNLVEAQRLPTSRTSGEAQTALLDMSANIRGYLALGNRESLIAYTEARELFQVKLAELEAMSENWSNVENVRRLEELQERFQAFEPLAEELFVLHDNPGSNRPAVRLYRLNVEPFARNVENEMIDIIELQQRREISAENVQLLRDLDQFSASFGLMMTNLAAYSISPEIAFRKAYEDQLAANEAVWERLLEQRSLLSADQQAKLDKITQFREQLADYPRQVIVASESEQRLEDMYLFRTEAGPQIDEMIRLLDEITTDQHDLLEVDLGDTRVKLANLRLQTIAGGGLALLLGIFMAIIFRANIAGPIRRLTRVAERITAGDLSARAQVDSGDEIGQLAANFNTMTGQLGQTIDRVSKRSHQLENVVQISQGLAGILDLNELLQQAVALVKETFDLYHVHIYLFDEAGENLVMAEGYGEAGAEMKRQGHHIPVTAPQSLVAQAARSGRSTQVDDVRTDEHWLPNPLLPDTRSEVAIPIKLDEKTVGVMDVQSDQVAGFDEQDVVIISTVATQVAVALGNARRFEDTARALAEAENLQQQYLRTGWQTFLAGRGATAYQQSKPDSKPVDEETVNRVRQSIRTGEKIVISQPGDKQQNGQRQPALAVPLSLRGQVIGNIRIHDTERERQWTADEVALLQSIGEQMSLALENARLFDQTRQRAFREQVAREISDKMRAAPDVDSIVETGLTELAKVLGVARAYVKLSPQQMQDQPTENAAIEAIRKQLKHNGRQAISAATVPDAESGHSDRGEE